MEPKHFRTGAIALGVVILLAVGVLLRPRGDEGEPGAENASIIAAAEAFADLTGNGAGALCSGGFLREEEPLAAAVARRIVENRIVDPRTGQRAATQDEAGITCLAEDPRWAFFTALNEHDGNDGRDYYCVDSAGAEGHLGLDRENVRCEPENR
jgi:hypothetical protein